MGSDPSPPRRTHVRATELLGYARLRRTDRLEQARLLWAGVHGSEGSGLALGLTLPAAYRPRISEGWLSPGRGLGGAG